MLARALEMSMEPGDSKPTTKTAASSEPNLAAMTEEEQIEYAMRMSMQVKNMSYEIQQHKNFRPLIQMALIYQTDYISQESDTTEGTTKEEKMDVDEAPAKQGSKPTTGDDGGEEDYSEVMNDPEFLQVF